MMIFDDGFLRGILTAQAFTAVILAGAVLGALWNERRWPLRAVMLGGVGVLVYVLAGQAKAYILGIPFDGFSWVGVAAYTVLVVGAFWTLSTERRGR